MVQNTKPKVAVCVRRAGRLVTARTVQRRAVRLLEALGQQGACLSLVLCDDAFIRDLNHRYRGIDKATDVLSFSMNEGEVFNLQPEMLGDVVISIETARKQAIRAKRPVLGEVTSLLVHGVLHLLGYDHLQGEAHRAMAAKADEMERLFERSS